MICVSCFRSNQQIPVPVRRMRKRQHDERQVNLRGFGSEQTQWFPVDIALSLTTCLHVSLSSNGLVQDLVIFHATVTKQELLSEPRDSTKIMQLELQAPWIFLSIVSFVFFVRPASVSLRRQHCAQDLRNLQDSTCTLLTRRATAVSFFGFACKKLSSTYNAMRVLYLQNWALRKQYLAHKTFQPGIFTAQTSTCAAESTSTLVTTEV